MRQVAHHQGDAREAEAAAAVLEGPHLRVDHTRYVRQLATDEADVEGLQLGAVHASARLPAAVACDIQ